MYNNVSVLSINSLSKNDLMYLAAFKDYFIMI